MDGAGMVSAARPMHADQCFDATNGCEPAVEAERAAAIEHVRRKIEAVKGRSGWSIAVEEAAHLVRVLDELAEDLGRGLHVKDQA